MLKILKKRKITLGALIFLLDNFGMRPVCRVFCPHMIQTHRKYRQDLLFSGVIICSAPIILEGIFCQELFMEVK